MTPPNTSFDAVVVGGGAAGLAAAISLAKQGCRVAILEAMPSPGRKLAISGGAKCNFTNVLPPREFAARFGREQERFVRPALLNFPPEKLREFFALLGCPSNTEDGFHYFPVGKKAADMVRALTSECKLLDVELRTSCRVAELLISDQTIRGVRLADGTEISAAQVVLATGGKSYPQTGSDGSGYTLARQAGHRINPLFPSLAGIKTSDELPAMLAGISLPDAAITIPNAGKNAVSRGTLLFTHEGLSGTAAMNISGVIAEKLAEIGKVQINLNIDPQTDAASWLAKFQAWQLENGKSSIKNLLARQLPERLAIALTSPKNFTAANFPIAERKSLAAKLCALPLTAVATGAFDRAMVTRGGVCRDEVDPTTMASKIVSGLFFAGEVLDVDGPCGGFNIQWAFSSGFQVKAQKN